MKKVKLMMITLMVCLVGMSYGQKDTAKLYVATSLQLYAGDGEFKSTTLPAIEVGIRVKDVKLVGVFGRNNFNSTQNEVFDNYWFEVKFISSYKLYKNLYIYGLFGAGKYIGYDIVFLDFGGGLTMNFNKIELSIQVNDRWHNRTNNYNSKGFVYIAPIIGYTF